MPLSPQCKLIKQMQSAIKSADPTRPAKKTVLNTLSYIYRTNGLKGLYRGVAPRIGLGKFPFSYLGRVTADTVGAWQTICMVSFADYVKAA